MALWGWALSAAAAAEPNAIKLETLPADSAPVQGARPGGFNYGLAMQVALYEQEWEALGVQALRFPPGNDADNFPLTSDMMDAFKVQWELLGQPAVLIVANFFEGPAHALRVVRYFESIGVPVRSMSLKSNSIPTTTPGSSNCIKASSRSCGDTS